MDTELFQEFLSSPDTLRVLEGDRPLFVSREDILFPLLDYIENFSHLHPRVTILDKTVGNAAALLAVKAGAAEVYSPLGSQLAADTLRRFERTFSFTETVPFIKARNGRDMCPMEQLSISREMTPDEFYVAVRARLHRA